MDHTYLTPEELVARYKSAVTVETLANWRTKGVGPPYTKVGNKPRYELAGVVAWEKSRERTVEAAEARKARVAQLSQSRRRPRARRAAVR